MEKFRPTPFTEIVRELFELCDRVDGCDQVSVKTMVRDTLQTARLNHEKDMHNAQTRRLNFKRNRSATLRRLAPHTGPSLLKALNQQVQMMEQRMLNEFGSILTPPPQTCRDRYQLALLNEMLRNPLAAVVGALMMEHSYRQRDARKVYELLMQDDSLTKPDKKFYEKRTEINEILKNRFHERDWFLSTQKSHIQTAAISENEADQQYSFLARCARLLGEPVFSTRFDRKEILPALTSNTHNFDEENEVDYRRIRAVADPLSLENLLNSLGYTNMNKKVKGPVLSPMISGNGYDGNHNTPWCDQSEADKQAGIDSVVNDFIDSAEFRRNLKNPKLEVVVDGSVLCPPFTTMSRTPHHFHLPGVAKFIQVFATQNGMREMVSNLSLDQTQLALGKDWYSELLLEGKQTVSLMLQPTIDESGKLTCSDLVVGYQPRLTLKDKLECLVGRFKENWPAWLTNPVFACAVAVLGLAPFAVIEISSIASVLIMILSVLLFLMAVGKIRPAWPLARPQQVAVHGFVSANLILMLVFGVLPIARDETNDLQEHGLVACATGWSQSGGESPPLTEPPPISKAADARNLPPTSPPSIRTPATEGRGERPRIVSKTGPRKEYPVSSKGAGELALHDVIHVELLVDTAKFFPLFGHLPMAEAEVVQVYGKSPSQTAAVFIVADATMVPQTRSRTVGESQSNSSDGKTPGGTRAVVVLEPGVHLANLRKGDVLNASFKPLGPSTTDPRDGVLPCAATGVVREIKTTNGTNVEVRVGLVVTWSLDGNTINSGKLDLLLTECATDKKSPYGVLAPSNEPAATVARNEPRVRKQ